MSKTAYVYLGTKLFCSPLEAIYTLLIFIIINELKATPLQVALLAGSKPLSSSIAFYLSSFMVGWQDRFKSYLIAINIISVVPALSFPFLENVWAFIAAHFIFTVGNRASFPVWNALLKDHVTKEHFSFMQSQAISIQQSLLIALPPFLGYLMDADKGIWKPLFCLFALFSLMSNILLMYLPSLKRSSSYREERRGKWQSAVKLIRRRADFTSYLLLFFLGGAGLVMMQSTLPHYFSKDLMLSYVTITIATSVCKGAALLATSRIWASQSSKMSLFQMNFYINLTSLLYIACISLTFFNVVWIFPAYIFYGIMQSGCELSWNLSGPYFAKEEESTLYASLNLPLIGLRGLIFPFASQYLMCVSGAYSVFISAALLTFASLLYARKLSNVPHFCLNLIPSQVSNVRVEAEINPPLL